MRLLIGVETLFLILVGGLVIGLLRSHGEVLSRLRELGELREMDRVSDSSRRDVRELSKVPTITGETVAGTSTTVHFDDPAASTVLAFLSSGCSLCPRFWQGSPERDEVVNGGIRLVFIAKGREEESIPKLKRLVPKDIPTIMSSKAWQDLDVPSYPYFVFVKGAVALAEGSAVSWSQVLSMVEDATYANHSAQDLVPEVDVRFSSETASSTGT
jgi:hypothetical protein